MNTSKEIFNDHFKTDFLSLVGDRTVNVRIVLARVLGEHFRKMGSCVFDPLVNHAIRLLKQDRSFDVGSCVQDITTVQTKGQSNESNSEDRSSESSHASETSHQSTHSTIDESMNLDNFLEYLSRHRKSETSDTSSMQDLEDNISTSTGVSLKTAAKQGPTKKLKMGNLMVSEDKLAKAAK